MHSLCFLELRVIDLGSADMWPAESKGTCFVFPKTSGGRYRCKTAEGLLAEGDVLVVNEAAQSLISPANGSRFSFSFFCLQPENLYPLFRSEEISMVRSVLADFDTTKLYIPPYPTRPGDAMT